MRWLQEHIIKEMRCPACNCQITEQNLLRAKCIERRKPNLKIQTDLTHGKGSEYATLEQTLSTSITPLPEFEETIEHRANE